MAGKRNSSSIISDLSPAKKKEKNATRIASSDTIVLAPLDYDANFLSQIIDEVVMLMKDAKDKASYSYLLKGNVPKNTLPSIIHKTEYKHGLSPGTIKESTVLSRIKSYKQKYKFSLLPSIEATLLRQCLRAAQSRPDLDAEDVLHTLAVIRMAKALLKSKERRLDEIQQRRYQRAKDWMQLDDDWVHDFKGRSYESLQQQGVFLHPSRMPPPAGKENVSEHPVRDDNNNVLVAK